MASTARERTEPDVPGSVPVVRAGPLGALIVGALAMGLSPVFVRQAAADVGPFASAFWRVALALPALFVWMRWEGGRRVAVGRPTWLAGGAFAGDLFFWHLAILATSIANATFFATLAPVVVMAASWLVLRQRVDAGALRGVALCLGGGAALALESATVAPGRLAGDLFGCTTAVFFALYTLAIARARTGGPGAAPVSAGAVTFWSSAVAAALLLAAALLFDGARFWPERAAGWTPLVLLALVSQVGGQGLFAVALGRLPAVFSSLVIFLEAVFAAAAGFLVLGERVSIVGVTGGALILIGIWAARPRAPAASSL